MEEQKRRPFPIKVILRDFFVDHRQKAYICVKGHWRTILDMQNHIINLFNLSHEVFLTDSEGFLYPAQESIEIIQQGNYVITVHRQAATGELSVVPVNGKTFKPPRNSTPFFNGQDAPLHVVDEIEVTETPIVGIPPPKENGAVLPEVREKQKRRKRVRKRKKNNTTHVEEDSSSAQEEVPEKTKRHKTASHIRFGIDADGDEESVVDNLQITDTPLGQSQVIVSRTLHKSNEKSPVAACSKANLTKTNMSSSFALEELREKLPNLDVPLLKKLPKKDDVIAFKILKMGESYEPILSNFIIGIVETVTKEKNEVAILLLSGEEELKPPQGKFSLPESEAAQCDDTLDDDLFIENFSKLQEVRKLDLAKLGKTF